MGLFKSIRKIVSKIFRGVKKAFRKVGEVVKKIFASKAFKIISMVASVFTMGIALAASVGSFASMSGGLGAKFIAGGKAFVSALANPISAAKVISKEGVMVGGQAIGTIGADAAAGLSNAATQAAETLASVGATEGLTDPLAAIPGVDEVAGTLSGATGVAPSITGSVPTSPGSLLAGAAPPTGAAEKIGASLGKDFLINRAANTQPGMLSKAGSAIATGAKGLAGNSGVWTGLGSIIQGFARGKANEADWKRRQDERDRINNLWNDYQFPEDIFNVNVPSGLGARQDVIAGKVAQRAPIASNRITSNVRRQSGGVLEQARTAGGVI